MLGGMSSREWALSACGIYYINIARNWCTCTENLKGCLYKSTTGRFRYILRVLEDISENSGCPAGAGKIYKTSDSNKNEWLRLTAGLRSMRDHVDHKFAIFRVECETRPCIYASLLSAWGAPIQAPGDFCVLQVQMDRDKGEKHQKIFFCLRYARSWTQIFYKRSRFCWNSKSTVCWPHVKIRSYLLSIYRWSHGSAKIYTSLYRVSTLRPLSASQHKTRVQFGIPTNNTVQIQKLGKDVSCLQGKHSTMIELVKKRMWSASALHKS